MRTMGDLLLQAQTHRQIDDFVKSPSHAVLLHGSEGAGKRRLAATLATRVLGLADNALASYPYHFSLEPEDGVLRIEAIRKLQDFTRLKTPGQAGIRRTIIIQSAHLMTLQAQNAFLKLLEEPPVDTLLVLTSSNTQQLLPTVTSRLQQILVRPLDEKTLIDHFVAKGHTEAAVKRAFYISDGQIGLLSALLTEDADHALVSAIAQAKALLGADTYSRLLQVTVLAKQKDTTPILLLALRRVAHAGLSQSSAANRAPAVRRWHRTLEAVYDAQTANEHNANLKLLYTDLLLNL